jgi:hypothetical protein|tara:strand:+ start:35 stop:412 length:378 start_codon:yes stop_codon:yes gene_type:complete
MALIVGGTTVTGTQTLDATKLTGNLPEISGADLTNLPAPTATAVGAGNAGLGGGDVGSTGFFREYQGGHSWSGPFGGTTSGSSLRASNAQGNHPGSVQSGTWVRMGSTNNPAGQDAQTTVFLRQS